uniref:Uncharacterized protein n=1 Tax=Anthurium amnicola TaxID=1678845 RepID=A0A1D1XEN7_9ARAE
MATCSDSDSSSDVTYAGWSTTSWKTEDLIAEIKRRYEEKIAELEAEPDGEDTDSDESEDDSGEQEENIDSDVGGYADFVEVELPYKIENMTVLETIHNVFKKVERIGDILIFKLDGGVKIDVHLALQSSIQQQSQGWWVRSEVTCVANNNEYRPDVGGWRRKPTLAQRTKPIVYNCPPPDLWIEVIFNYQKERNKMLTKLRTLRGNSPNIDHVLIALKTTITPIRLNPNPGAQSVVATVKGYRPQRAPYAGQWRPGARFNQVRWYKVEWNKHIVLACGASLYFNDILNQYI